MRDDASTMTDDEPNMTDNNSSENENDSSENENESDDENESENDTDSLTNEHQRPARRTRRSVPWDECEFCGKEFWGASASSDVNRHIRTYGLREARAIKKNGKDNGRGKHPAVRTSPYERAEKRHNFRGAIQTLEERKEKKRASDAKYRKWRIPHDRKKLDKAFTQLR
jgi:hypothetical protein